MKLRAMLISLGLVVVAVGCSHPNPSGASGQVSRDSFERSKDPPINARTYFAAGQLAESQGQAQKAAANYRAAILQKHDYLDAMYRLGVVYAELKDWPHAIETWNRYIALSGGASGAYSNLGFCQELAGNAAAAEAAYRMGLTKDPSNEPCHVNYGLMLARHGRPAEALMQLQTALPPAQAHYDLASVYEMQGHKTDARAEYQKAIELDPSLRDAKAKLASLN